MRRFDELQASIELAPGIDGRDYREYHGFIGGKRSVVRRFCKAIPSASTLAYVSLLRGVEDWLVQHPGVARWVRLELPMEIGADFAVFAREVYTTSLDSYDDSEQSDIEIPDELEMMRTGVRHALGDGPGRLSEAQFRIVRRVLERSLMGPTLGTFLSGREGRFVIQEPEVNAADVNDWERTRPITAS